MPEVRVDATRLPLVCIRAPWVLKCGPPRSATSIGAGAKRQSTQRRASNRSSPC